ncbi:MAG: hypothetical protein HOC71_18430 [Candidatus Latescibacteria bacterium]|jgi:hypothetical protein|nr:hypothetical protein [Candidatus Latescibacterota bacterium]
MKRTTFYLMLGVFLLLSKMTGVFAEENRNYPKRLRRSESFLGIHFDFHAGDDCTEIGKNVDREMIEFIIDQVKPDYLQCDCKGHRGLSSYPTNVGNPAPGFVLDPLKIWREVTAERGVALYVHYSGIGDEEAVKSHPEWARIDENGKPDTRATSVFGPYVDKLLIPQIKEIIDKYNIDGIWIDGDWMIQRDYRDKAIKAFQEQTGITTIPKKPEDPCWFEFTEFARNEWRKFIYYYVTEIHKHNPDFQICSNSNFSYRMPEPSINDVDFLSCDMNYRDSVNSVRIQGRCMVYQGKPWDLMAWSFNYSDGGFCTKSIPQLEQEAAIILSLGGGFEAYFPQKRDGSIRKWQMKLMKEISRFCRERQHICHKAEPVPQIGLIYYSEAFYRKLDRVVGGWNPPAGMQLRGILKSLLDSQNVVDIVMEHSLQARMNEYPLLIFPEWEYIDPDFKKELLDYVSNGGNLLIIGPESASLFEKELNIELIDKAEEKINYLEYNGWLAGIKSLSQKIKLGNNAKSFGKIYSDNDFNTPYETAASINDYGKGKIAAIYLDLGERYCNAGTSVGRDFLNSLIHELFPEPIVEVTGSHFVDVTVNTINDKLAVNLVNTSGPHNNPNIKVFDEVPPEGPLQVSIMYANKPEKVTLEPAGKELIYNYKNGKIQLTLPGLEIHDIIVVE